MMLPAVPAVDLTALPGVALDDVVNGVLDVVARLLHTRLAVVSRIESTTCTVMAVVDHHHVVRPGHLFELHETFCVHMLESGQALCIDDTTRAPLPLRTVPAGLDLHLRSYAGIPLTMADGRVFGSLWAADPAPRHFTPQDRALLQLMGRLLIYELDRDVHLRHSERIEQVRSTQTNTDSLTGLLTRDGFELMLVREAARRDRYRMPYAVAILHLAINDTAERLGEASVDTLRQELADILMRTSRMVDCCARIDTNTFAVLFAETHGSGVHAWQARINDAISAWNLVHTASGLHMSVQTHVVDGTDLSRVSTVSTLQEIACSTYDHVHQGSLTT